MAEEKATKQEANYRNGHGEQLCQNCTMFVEPEGCTSVKGYIDRLALCDYFEKKDA